MNLAKSVNSFMKNSVVDTPYVKTEALSIDEPSIGFTDLLNVEREDLIDVLETSVKGLGIPVQMHLHTLKSADITLQTESITTLTGEFAATPENVKLITKRDLDTHDKFMRAGVTRTNIDSIIAEYLDRGIEPTPHQLIDEKEVIRKRIKKLDSTFGERVSSWGPDCGLGSWPTHEVAGELLKRTAEAVRESFK
jgi:5-methyltetrahydropteroyltriglutamate--homocysteine methyltransferase